MVWRAQGAEARQIKGFQRKRAMEKRIRGGVPLGLLGYLDGEPVAWCSIAPRPTYRRLGGPEVAGEEPAKVWSLACFFLRRDLRRQGVTAQLIEAAVAHARAGSSAADAPLRLPPWLRWRSLVVICDRPAPRHPAPPAGPLAPSTRSILSPTRTSPPSRIRAVMPPRPRMAL